MKSEIIITKPIIKGALVNSNETIVGLTEAICPYCAGKLDKFPGRKKKCPHCGNYIYVRTRPSDRVKILIREDQIEDVEELWAIENGCHEEYLAQKQRWENKEAQLTKQMGKAPTDNDIQYALHEDELLNTDRPRHPSVYRNIRYDMADLLIKERQYQKAFDLYLEIIFFDVNASIEAELLNRDAPIWDTFLVKTIFLLENSLINSNSVKQRFLFITQQIYNTKVFSFTCTPNEVWEIINDQFQEYLNSLVLPKGN